MRGDYSFFEGRNASRVSQGVATANHESTASAAAVMSTIPINKGEDYAMVDTLLVAIAETCPLELSEAENWGSSALEETLERPSPMLDVPFWTRLDNIM